MNKRRLYRYLKRAIEIIESKLYGHGDLLERFGMTEDDYQKIMNDKPERIQGDK